MKSETVENKTKTNLSTWRKVSLIDCIDLIGGGTPKTSVTEYWDGNIPWLSVKDFNNDNRYVYTTEKHISEKGLANSSTKLLQKDDIIISARGTVGELAMIPFPMAFNQSCYGIRAKAGINKTFLYYLLKNIIKQLKAVAHGSVFDTITRDTFSNIFVNIPDEGSQGYIASILSAFDDKIALNNKINENLEQQAQAVYDLTFISFDGVSNNEFQKSEFGMIPKGWTIRQLSDVTKNVRDRVKDNMYEVLSALNTGNLCPSEEYFSKQVFSKNIKNYIVVEPFDFAYNPSRINIGSIGMNDLGYTGCVSPVYVVVRPEKEYQYLLDFFIKSKRFKEEVKTRASGSVRQSLSYADFGQIKVIYPPIDVVEKFNGKYAFLLSAMNHYKKEIEMLESLRDVLLPKLINGEINLADYNI